MNSIIKRPIITEKSVSDAHSGVFAFEVDRHARKREIAKEIERLFSVHVVDVHTLIMHGRTRRTGKRRIAVKRSDWKKAYVKLRKGEKIDLFSVAQ